MICILERAAALPPNKRLKLTEPPAVQSGLVRGDGKDGSH